MQNCGSPSGGVLWGARNNGKDTTGTNCIGTDIYSPMAAGRPREQRDRMDTYSGFSHIFRSLNITQSTTIRSLR